MDSPVGRIALWPGLALWLGLWALGGTLFVLLVRRGITYVDRYLLTAGFFLLMSALVIVSFWPVLAPRIVDLGIEHVLALAGVVALQIIAHRVTRRRLHRPARLIEANRHIYWLRLDDRYLVSKPCEILFQQALIASLVLTLGGAGLARAGVIGLSAVIFGLAHLPLLKLVGRFFGWFYVVSSTIGAALFAGLILAGPQGLVTSYVVHWLFYTAAGVFFWATPGTAGDGGGSPDQPRPPQAFIEA